MALGGVGGFLVSVVGMGGDGGGRLSLIPANDGNMGFQPAMDLDINLGSQVSILNGPSGPLVPPL